MSSDQFCLKWNDYHSSLTSAVSKIRDEDDFFDISLVCEGNIAQAHRLVLSACSPLFRAMLKNQTHPHPMIFLRGIRFADLKAILNFMYHGEVNVDQEDLQFFLAAAEELRIKGLSQGNNENKGQTCSAPIPISQPGSVQSSSKAASRSESPNEGPPSAKKRKTSESPEELSAEDEEGESGEDLQDVDQDLVEPELTLSVKPEFNSTAQSALMNNSKTDDDDDSNGQSNIVDCLVQAQGYAYQGFNSNNIHNIMAEGSSNIHLRGEGGNSPQQGFTPPGVGGLPYEMHRLGGRNEDGLAHVVVMKTIRGWHCPHCSYVSPSQKGNLKVHILNRHASPGESFGCMFCGKHLSSRSSLQVHISQVHREQNKAKRMIEERLKISNLEERLTSEMASGILASGTAEALRQARQSEERLKSDMLGLLRNQEDRTKEEMISLLMQQEERTKDDLVNLLKQPEEVSRLMAQAQAQEDMRRNEVSLLDIRGKQEDMRSNEVSLLDIRGKEVSLNQGALTIQSIRNPSAVSVLPAEDDLPLEPPGGNNQYQSVVYSQETLLQGTQGED